MISEMFFGRADVVDVDDAFDVLIDASKVVDALETLEASVLFATVDLVNDLLFDLIDIFDIFDILNSLENNVKFLSLMSPSLNSAFPTILRHIS